MYLFKWFGQSSAVSSEDFDCKMLALPVSGIAICTAFYRPHRIRAVYKLRIWIIYVEYVRKSKQTCIRSCIGRDITNIHRAQIAKTRTCQRLKMEILCR